MIQDSRKANRAFHQSYKTISQVSQSSYGFFHNQKNDLWKIPVICYGFFAFEQKFI